MTKGFYQGKNQHIIKHEFSRFKIIINNYNEIFIFFYIYIINIQNVMITRKF
jgi:hypothetical protein